MALINASSSNIIPTKLVYKTEFSAYGGKGELLPHRTLALSQRKSDLLRIRKLL
jgi:hypothetical protein